MPRGDEKFELIRSVPLFAHCDRRELEEIAEAADLIDVPAGLTLVTQGQHTNEFVVIAQGAAEVTRDGAQAATLGPGDFFGEIALITGAPRTATVTATEASTLLVLTDRAFGRVTDDIPSIATSVLRVLGERLHPEAV
jgi:CRP-like cAMP-binding protein